MKAILSIMTLVSVSLFAGAAPVFFDDFNSENGGVGALNYTGFAQWTVSDGTVDLIGNGFYDFLPGNGLYVDMDGSTGDAGKMITSPVITLQPGSYVLSYALAGNHRNAAQETVNVAVNTGIFTASHSLLVNDPFTLFSNSFSIATPTTISISFEGIGGDNIGMLLDDVKLVAVPAPGAILLAGIGTSLVGWLRRRQSM